jgi:hypothetical protein
MVAGRDPIKTHCHLNRIIDQRIGDLESCSSALASKLCFANCNDRAQQEHRCGSVGYALPAAAAPVDQWRQLAAHRRCCHVWRPSQC